MGIKIKQHDITDCGAACIASVCAHYKLHVPIARIRQKAGTDKRGTNLFGMIKAVESLGLSAKGVKVRPDMLDKVPLPTIAHLITEKQLHHYVVLYRTGKRWFRVMDPQSGKLEKWRPEKFLKQWTEVLLLLAPSEGFEPANAKPSVARRFIHLLRPHRLFLAQALIGACIYTVLGLAFPIYIQKITDQVLASGNINLLNLLSVAMLLVILLQIVIGWLKSMFMIRTGQLIDATLIMGYYRHLLSLSQTFFDTMRIGEILSRIGDAVKIRSFINDSFIGLIVGLFIILFSSLLMFTYYWKFSVMALLSIPVYSVLYWISNMFNKKWERRLMENAAGLETQFVESLNNIRTIKQCGLESYAALRTEQKFTTLLDSIFQSGRIQIAVGTSAELIGRLFTVALLWAGSYYVLHGLITPGELLSFYALIGYFHSPVQSLIAMNKTFQTAWIAADRLFEILDLEVEKNDDHEIQLDKSNLGDIVFERVNFQYGTRTKVFSDLNLHIAHGSTVGIVGESGCGKSTIAAILQKLYLVEQGKVSIGNLNLRYISLRSLRKIIGVVPQEIEIFAGSILENISLGDPEPDIPRVLEICAQLGLLPFIEAHPDGFGALLGENGVNLSGGQKQRLGIARAMYRNPEILILDEATASLDYASEACVDEALVQLKKEGKTILIIAHRLSTVMKADKIVVLKNGQVCQEGPHLELLQKKGEYAALWARQFPRISGTTFTEPEDGHQSGLSSKIAV